MAAALTFDAAAALVTGGGVRPPQATLLRLYGLYTLAVRGPCDSPPPPAFDFRGRAKHGAYAAASAEGLSPDAVRAAYVALVASLPRDGGDARGAADASQPPPPPPPTGLGAKGSTGFVVGATEWPPPPPPPPPPGAAAATPAAAATATTNGDAPPAGGGRPPSPPIDLGHWAAVGDAASTRYVLEGYPTAAAAAAAVNATDEEGLTPLIRAADRGHGPVVALLLAAGADTAVADGEGWTPLRYAAECGWPAVAAALVAAGADVAAAGGVDNWEADVREAVADAAAGRGGGGGGAPA
ncbi:hypothetical protein BU14_0565s0006 [Porphyra umbilicalis]|uniref:ACB domain-containing protein n=1 Tax=Porphyra umbilicalis TaxID=2786 RepID=A0A1X6NRR5_PORUM|nr:hypothetical protein BU14_0565s0006 [Porphyra umbilicalis]|eukprot:OSX71275.1 hypothetical protein BU14_0565s0006 [Porphyra umbilicalis]